MSRARPNLTEGSTIQALIKLAVPIVFANVLQTAYQLIDTFWVGRLGSNAVAAVSLSFPVIFLMISLGVGFAVAGTTLVAQHTGRGEPDRVNHVAAQALFGIVAVAIVLAVVGFVFARLLVVFLGAQPSVVPLATQYLQVSFIGLVFLFAYVIFQSLMRGVGDARTPLLIVFGTVVLNFVLDPLFILGLGPIPAWGVSGAALTTVITQGLAAAVGLGSLFSGHYGIHLVPDDLWPDPAMQWRLIKLGFPAAIEQSTRALGLLLMTILVSGFGTVTLAAYGVGTRILSFAIIPALGLSQATSALVGQNVGAGKPNRAAHTTWASCGIGMIALTVFGIGAFIFAQPLVALFVPGSSGVISTGTMFVRITALTYGLIGVQQVIAGAFRGAGYTLAAMALALISLWVLQFPIAWLLSERTGLGVTGIWVAYPVRNVLTAIVAVVWFARGTWRQYGISEASTATIEHYTTEREASRVRTGAITDTTSR